jgi:hypothetical protein
MSLLRSASTRAPRRLRASFVASASAALVVLCGCASTIAPPAPLADARTAPPLAIEGDESGVRAPNTGALDDALVAVVGDRAIMASELLAGLRQRDARLLNFHLNLLVGERLAEIAAERVGVVLDDTLVQTRGAAAEAAFVAELDGAPLEKVLRDELGVDPEAFRRRLLDDARRELLTERVVRSWTLAQDTARVRILVASSAEVARATERFAAGESFAALASELSRDPTGAQGGLVPYVVRSDRSRLARLAFRTEAGALGGPFALEDEGLELLVFVESFAVSVSGAWSDVSALVEASLLAHEVSEEEYLQWQVAMEAAYFVDLGPISRLLGEDLR